MAFYFETLSFGFTVLEYLGIAFTLLYIIFASKGDLWCWPMGIAASAIYIEINIVNNLFQDAILQFYYVLAGLYGWWMWNRKDHHEERNIISYTFRQNLPLIVGGAVLVPVFGYIFSKVGNSLSYYDSAVTVFSFIATWMTAKKIIQNWLFWIVIDALAAVMYAIKGLYPTAILYIVLSALALYAYMEWNRQFRLEQNEALV